MLPMRFESFKDINRELGLLHREMDELFRKTFGITHEHSGAVSKFVPLVNCFVKDEIYHVQFEIPGASKQDLEVSVDGNLLTVRGERKMSRDLKDDDYLVREFQTGTFLRRLSLPEGVSGDKIKATYQDGMLEITMPMETKKKTTSRTILIEGPEQKPQSKELH